MGHSDKKDKKDKKSHTKHSEKTVEKSTSEETVPKTIKRHLDDVESSTTATPDVDSTSKSSQKEESPKVEEPAAKRIRTRSMDAAEADSLYSFSRYPLSPETIGILNSHGITELFPIQALTFDPIFNGKDLIGRAYTGQGKTLAFLLPIVEKIRKLGLNPPRRTKEPLVLILSPTRELASQIEEQVEMIAPHLRSVCLFGGTSYDPQERALLRGVEIVVGTPGRVIDHIERNNLRLNSLQFLVLDEADRMLDMGFQEDVEKVIKACNGTGETENKRIVPEKIQVLLFSATIPSWIRGITDRYMREDREIVDLVEEKEKASGDVEHFTIRFMSDLIDVYAGDGQAIIFCDMKKSCNELAAEDCLRGKCCVLHGDIPQNTRESTLQDFKDKKYKCLIATDVAARGLDIKGISLVINREPPCTRAHYADVETYIHRSGRTGRAGKKGICITFHTGLGQETSLKEIEKAVGNPFVRIGAPQPEDLLRVKVINTIEKVKGEGIYESVYKVISPEVEKMLDEFQNSKGDETQKHNRLVKMISSFIGIGLGCDQPLKHRSLLSGSEGFITIQFISLQPIRTLSYIWGALNRAFPEDLVQTVKSLTLTKDEMGA
ncbi:hypothetical protein WA158_006299 [Blastocystis sp. Blastoise]